MQNYLLLVAGGTGNRMGSEIPKQFLLLDGKPVIYYSVRQFLESDPAIRIVVVIHPDWKEELQDILQKFFPEKGIEIAFGGETRFHSVKNGLAMTEGEGIVCIHDAARPLVSNETITRCITTTEKKCNAVPVLKINESLRKIEGNTSLMVNRDEYRIVQTPQCFLLKEIREAYSQEYNPGFTDDASVLEKAGKKINLVDGNPENIKITYPVDLHIAEFLVRNKSFL